MIELLSKTFIKNHRDTENAAVRGAYGTLVSIIGIILNFLLFVAKFLVGTFFGSVAILGDSINNLSDAGSQLISLISFRIALKPADREHPFGHARIEYVASMIVSFLVLHIGIDLLKESIAKIFSPERPERSWIAVAVLLGSILVKLWIALLNRTIGKRIDSPVMHATAADSISDVFSTSAVLLATLIPMLFPSVTLNLDAYIGVAVAVLILVAGAKILNDTKNSILGVAPSEETIARITSLVESTPGALGIHDLVVHSYGAGHTIASLHVEVDGKINVFESHDMIDNIERKLLADYGIEATVHMDPIVTDDEQVNALREQVCAVVAAIDSRLRIHDFRFVAGTTHTNLIFDIATPFECKLTDTELCQTVSKEISKINPAYYTVITIDRE